MIGLSIIPGPASSTRMINYPDFILSDPTLDWSPAQRELDRDLDMYCQGRIGLQALIGLQVEHERDLREELEARAKKRLSYRAFPVPEGARRGGLRLKRLSLSSSLAVKSIADCA